MSFIALLVIVFFWHLSLSVVFFVVVVHFVFFFVLRQRLSIWLPLTRDIALLVIFVFLSSSSTRTCYNSCASTHIRSARRAVFFFSSPKCLSFALFAFFFLSPPFYLLCGTWLFYQQALFFFFIYLRIRCTRCVFFFFFFYTVGCEKRFAQRISDL